MAIDDPIYLGIFFFEKIKRKKEIAVAYGYYFWLRFCVLLRDSMSVYCILYFSCSSKKKFGVYVSIYLFEKTKNQKKKL